MSAKWLVAHELSHILLGHVYHKYKNGQQENNKINEFQANALASTIFYNNRDYAETMITEPIWVRMMQDAKHISCELVSEQDITDYADNLIREKYICYDSYVYHYRMFHKYRVYLDKKNIFPGLYVNGSEETVAEESNTEEDSTDG